MLQPSYKSSPQFSGAWASHCTSSQEPHCCSHPDSHGLHCFSSNKTFFPLYYFTPNLHDYRKAVDSSAKTQTNEAVLRLDGIKSLAGSVQGAPLPLTLWGGEEQPSSAASPDCKVEKITIHSTENVSFGSSYENAIHPVHSLYAPAQ